MPACLKIGAAAGHGPITFRWPKARAAVDGGLPPWPAPAHHPPTAAAGPVEEVEGAPRGRGRGEGLALGGLYAADLRPDKRHLGALGGDRWPQLLAVPSVDRIGDQRADLAALRVAAPSV